MMILFLAERKEFYEIDRAYIRIELKIRLDKN